jgi:multimeric flavodoxin WrbA
MKVLLLDGSDKDDVSLNCVRTAIERILNNKYELNVFVLRDLVIHNCIGCYGCWLKTPGRCIIDDVSRKITDLAARSSVWIFLTPVVYGGYSWYLKKAVDRMLPLFLPFFTKRDEETHHFMRCNNASSLIVFGATNYNNKESEDIFKSLVSRNSLNFSNSNSQSIILSGKDSVESIEEIVENSLNKVGVLDE